MNLDINTVRKEVKAMMSERAEGEGKTIARKKI